MSKRKVSKRKVDEQSPRDAKVPGGLLEALRAATGWLSAAGVGFAVIGGVAASIHGRPRVTKDVDLVVTVDDDQWVALVRRAARWRLRPRIADALDFARTTRVLLLVHTPSMIEIDVSFGMLPFEHDTVARARMEQVNDLRFPLATPEDIVVMKALALRARDIADIEGIVDTVRGLDIERIRRHVAELSAALEAQDHLAAIEPILRRAQGS